jgi:hypothetical protein
MSHSTPPTFSESSFVRVASDQWIVSPCVEASRIQRLHNSPSYDAIVAQIGRTATVLCHKREGFEQKDKRKKPDYFRVIVRLSADAAAVDLLHNSANGYRAQYYHCGQLGIQANKFALSQLVPIFITLMAERFKRTCPAWWVEKSLLDPDAKIWIHQGLWLHSPETSDRTLLVPRWLERQGSQDQNCRKKAVWASLRPDKETQLELKGGWMTLDGKSFGSLKPGRTTDLHELGFS